MSLRKVELQLIKLVEVILVEVVYSISKIFKKDPHRASLVKEEGKYTVSRL